MKRRYIILSAIALIILLGAIWVIWGNTTVGLTEYSLKEDALPAAFHNYRIAHVSDLHNSWLWEKAIAQIKRAKPDIICITGDLVDSSRTNVQLALEFAAQAVQIAPCYYAPGNHERRLETEVYEQLIQGLQKLGVIVLHDESILLAKEDGQIRLSGLGWDPNEAAAFTDFDGYDLLLAHHPEFFDIYAQAAFDLVLSGHIHGGQFRLPFVGGLYAPNQGFLPEYDAGHYTKGNTDMFINRGIGNSSFPIRFNNRPEVIILTLKCH